jgi:hypothetical protein
LEFQQDGHSPPDAPPHLGRIHYRSALARVKENPSGHQYDQKDAENGYLGPFGFPAQQNYGRNYHQENCDPNRRVLIEDRHFLSVTSKLDFQEVVGTL